MTQHRLWAGLILGSALAAALAGAAAAAEIDDDGMVTATPSVRAGEAASKGDAAAEEDSLGKKVGDYLSQVHGEVGVMVGTNDMHAIYGTAVLPLGEDGSLTLSFEQSRNAYYGPFYGSVFGPGPVYGGVPRRVR